MGFFSYLLGTGKHNGSYRLSNIQYPLSITDIERLVSHFKIKSLDKDEEKIVEKAIIARRLGDHKISLRQIDEVLSKLQHTRKISQYDRKSLNNIFETFFKKNFGN